MGELEPPPHIVEAFKIFTDTNVFRGRDEAALIHHRHTLIIPTSNKTPLRLLADDPKDGILIRIPRRYVRDLVVAGYDYGDPFYHLILSAGEGLPTHKIVVVSVVVQSKEVYDATDRLKNYMRI